MTIALVQAAVLALMAAPVLLGVAVLLAVRRYPMTRRWAMVTVIGIAAFPVGAVLHNVLSVLIRGEEVVSFLMAIVVAPLLFTVGSIGMGLQVARTGRAWELGTSMAIAGSGMGLFLAYMALTLALTTAGSGGAPYRAAVEGILVPAAVIAVVGGSISTLFCALRPSRQIVA